jgi:hypothetical protein
MPAMAVGRGAPLGLLEVVAWNPAPVLVEGAVEAEAGDRISLIHVE